MPDNVISMSLDASATRQLGADGLFVLWRDGSAPERREGLACILSVCPHSECASQLVHVDGFVIDEAATAVTWGCEGVNLFRPGSESSGIALEPKMYAIVDPSSGETSAHPDLTDATDPALVEWLASEMDGELLDLLHRFHAQAKGYPLPRPRTNIDLDAMEAVHLAAFDEFFEGVRPDEYLLAGHRYWTGIYLCPAPDCTCHRARVAFFDDATESSDTVGSVLLDLSDTGRLKIVEMAAECGAPDHLIGELWALFERRHDTGPFLRQRESQAKRVGATLWRPVARPVRAAPKPGRNAPCPCGSRRKFKNCCLGKGGASPRVGGS